MLSTKAYNLSRYLLKSTLLPLRSFHPASETAVLQQRAKFLSIVTCDNKNLHYRWVMNCNKKIWQMCSQEILNKISLQSKIMEFWTVFHHLYVVDVLMKSFVTHNVKPKYFYVNIKTNFAGTCCVPYNPLCFVWFTVFICVGGSEGVYCMCGCKWLWGWMQRHTSQGDMRAACFMLSPGVVATVKPISWTDYGRNLGKTLGLLEFISLLLVTSPVATIGQPTYCWITFDNKWIPPRWHYTHFLNSLL